jgi:hypothetical protein
VTVHFPKMQPSPIKTAPAPKARPSALVMACEPRRCARRSSSGYAAVAAPPQKVPSPPPSATCDGTRARWCWIWASGATGQAAAGPALIPEPQRDRRCSAVHGPAQSARLSMLATRRRVGGGGGSGAATRPVDLAGPTASCSCRAAARRVARTSRRSALHRGRGRRRRRAARPARPIGPGAPRDRVVPRSPPPRDEAAPVRRPFRAATAARPEGAAAAVTTAGRTASPSRRRARVESLALEHYHAARGQQGFHAESGWRLAPTSCLLGRRLRPGLRRLRARLSDGRSTSKGVSRAARSATTSDGSRSKVVACRAPARDLMPCGIRTASCPGRPRSGALELALSASKARISPPSSIGSVVTRPVSARSTRPLRRDAGRAQVRAARVKAPRSVAANIAWLGYLDGNGLPAPCCGQVVHWLTAYDLLR